MPPVINLVISYEGDLEEQQSIQDEISGSIQDAKDSEIAGFRGLSTEWELPDQPPPTGKWVPAEQRLYCPNGHWIGRDDDLTDPTTDDMETTFRHWEEVGAKRTVEAIVEGGQIAISSIIMDIDYESSHDQYLMCDECTAEFLIPDELEIRWV